MQTFAAVAAVNLVICLALGFATRSKMDKEPPKEFKGHLRRYLTAWTLCIAGEWLCGPGVYALYASFGFDRAEIARLFVLGFACSSVLGCFAGSFADKFGRKNSVMLFCCFGVLACTLKHLACYPALIVARFLDGAHASLLYTAFESWLVAEHFSHHGFPPALLGHSFAMMFSISYFVAVACGLIAQVTKDFVPAAPPMGILHLGGWCVPFELSAVFQAAGLIYVAFSWDENYGMSNGASPTEPGPRRGLCRAFCTAKVLLCCALITFFESSMFVFVFSWTPALSPGGDHTALPAGLIFAVYMMACMSGSSIYRLCVGVRTPVIMLCIFFLAAAAMSVPALVGITRDTTMLNFAAFVVFEACVGAYFPAAASLKSEFVEEDYRTTIYNIFRTPMNLVVVFVLLNSMTETRTFQLLFGQLCVGTALLVAYTISSLGKRGDKEMPLLG